jgi:hypothetical protein
MLMVVALLPGRVTHASRLVMAVVRVNDDRLGTLEH